MVKAEVTERGGGGQGKERDQSLGMIVFDATTNHYDNGKDNAAVRTITASTMTARATKETSMRTTARTHPDFDATTSHDEDNKDNDRKDDDGKDDDGKDNDKDNNSKDNNNNNGISNNSNNDNYVGNDNHRGGSGG